MSSSPVVMGAMDGVAPESGTTGRDAQASDRARTVASAKRWAEIMREWRWRRTGRDAARRTTGCIISCMPPKVFHREHGRPAILLLSGGLDSTTMLALATSERYEVHALTFR